jgi:glycosyltransferase involved in cell wall biosynthesis
MASDPPKPHVDLAKSAGAPHGVALPMKVILARCDLIGPVSGADEALVHYALHLHRAGHLHSVTILNPPRRRDPYLLRLIAAGVPIAVVQPTPWLRWTLPALRAAAKRLRLSPGSPGPGVDSLRAGDPAGSRSVSAPMRLWRHLWEVRSRSHPERCRRRFERARADVIHIVGSSAGISDLIRAGYQAGVPVLYQHLGMADGMPEDHAFQTSFIDSIALCEQVAALSPALAAGWQERLPNARPIRVLPLLYDDIGTRRTLPAEGSVVRFGFAARFEAGKGPLVLLEAFSRLRRRCPQARLILSGVGSQSAEARALSERIGIAGACDFLGYTEERDKRALMESFDVFVLPTLAEGTPNSLVEAMMLGLPVVASRVGGIGDMFPEGSALLVPPNDVESLAAALARVANDGELRGRIGRAARQRYERLFHPDVVLPLLLAEYRLAASRGVAHAAPASVAHPWSSASGRLDPAAGIDSSAAPGMEVSAL